MMKELFGLERFDLSAKTGGLLKTVKNELIRLETQLEGLKNASEDLLKTREKERKELTKIVKTQENTFEKTTIQLQSQETIKKKYVQLLDFQSQWKNLQIRTKEIDHKKQELKAFIQANSYFRPIWNQIKDWQLELEKASTGTINCSRFCEVYSKEIETLEFQEAELSAKSEKRPQREAKIRDLEKVLEVQIKNNKLEAAQNELSTIQPAVNQGLEKQKVLEKQIYSLDRQLENSSKEATSTQLAKLSGDIKDWKTFLEHKNTLENALDQIKAKDKAIAESEQNILNSIPASFKDLQDWTSWEKENIKDQAATKEALIENKSLQVYVKKLHEGEPCPLCGSEHHPLPLVADHTEEKVESLNKLIANAQQTLEKTQKLSRQLYDLNLQRTNHAELINQKEKELKDIDLRFSSLKNNLSATGIHSLENIFHL
jgi:exonuclease SbcC